MTLRTLILCACGAASTALAAPEFARVYQDHMVVQRGVDLPVWGKAKANDTVVVVWQGVEKKTKANSKGEWAVIFAPSEAKSAPSVLSASDSTGKKQIADVLIGDVWLASGQSNMAYTMRSFPDSQLDVKSMKNPQLRYMQVSSKMHTAGGVYKPEDYAKWKQTGFTSFQWKTCVPKNVAHFSATATYFGQALQAELKVPVGIICNAVGGVGMESWLPEALLSKSRRFLPLKGDKWLDAKPQEFSTWMRDRARHNLKKVIAANEKLLVHPFKPSFLYENALKPLLPFPVKGVIWYQGESNAIVNDSEHNEFLMKALISGWRKAYRNEKLPFYMVQLPRIKDKTAMRAYWPQFREVQQKVADEMAAVDLICSLDLGMANADVHPWPKRPVGERLCKLALYHAYGQKEKPDSKLSPRIMQVKWESTTAHLTCSAKLQTHRNKPASGFAYSWRKGEPFVELAANIQGDKIEIALPRKPSTGAELRYNYSTFCKPNVTNKAGLPLFPWRDVK